MELKKEVLRKSLHLTGLLIPASYILFGKELTILFISLAIVAFFIIEPYRISRDTAKKIIEGIRPILKDEAFRIVSRTIESLDRKIREIAREEERMCIGAHIYFSISSLLVILFFPTNIAIGAITAATVGDAMAAVIGMRWGTHRFRNSKSLEGSIAFFFSAFLSFLFFVSWPYALLGAAMGAVAEFYNLPPNDNFSNQLVMAFVVYLAFMIQALP